MYKTHDVEKGLVFIVGCGRSGTTLVKSMLNSHPLVYISPETFFFSSITVKGSSLISREDKINHLSSYWWIKDMMATNKSIEGVFEECMRKDHDDWNEVFLALLGFLAKEEGVQIFGEKTPQHIRVATKLLATYKHCKILHIIRDPRAVYSSYLSVPVGTNQVSSVISEWSSAIDIHKELKGDPRYFSLKYEDLVGNPATEMQEVCKFLDITYDTAMLSFFSRKKTGYAPEQSHHKNTLSPVFKSSTDSWKEKLMATDIGLLEKFLGKEIAMMGYELTGEVISFVQIRHGYSKLCDMFARALIRRPRQLLKAFRAKRRIKKEYNDC